MANRITELLAQTFFDPEGEREREDILYYTGRERMDILYYTGERERERERRTRVNVMDPRCILTGIDWRNLREFVTSSRPIKSLTHIFTAYAFCQCSVSFLVEISAILFIVLHCRVCVAGRGIYISFRILTS